MTTKGKPLPDAAQCKTVPVRFDILHTYAAKHGLDYNDLCRTTLAAIAGSSPAHQVVAADAQSRYEYVRKLRPFEFSALYARNISGEGHFDDLVDAAIRAPVHQAAPLAEPTQPDGEKP